MKNETSQAIEPLEIDHRANPSFNPAALLDALIVRMNLKRDADLAKRLQLDRPVISKLRNRRSSLTAGVLLRMHDVTGLSARELRKIAGL